MQLKGIKRHKPTWINSSYSYVRSWDWDNPIKKLKKTMKPIFFLKSI
jgi:hypothetical protein